MSVENRAGGWLTRWFCSWVCSCAACQPLLLKQGTCTARCLYFAVDVLSDVHVDAFFWSLRVCSKGIVGLYSRALAAVHDHACNVVMMHASSAYAWPARSRARVWLLQPRICSSPEYGELPLAVLLVVTASRRAGVEILYCSVRMCLESVWSRNALMYALLRSSRWLEMAFDF
jgi:hypothetical protein